MNDIRSKERNAMRRIIRACLRAFVGATGLVVSLAAVAHTQQTASNTAPLTAVQTAGVKSFKDMIKAVNSGDYAPIRDYFDGQRDPNGSVNALSRYHHSRGYDLLRVETVPNRGDLVAGIVRNRLTGDEEYLG